MGYPSRGWHTIRGAIEEFGLEWPEASLQDFSVSCDVPLCPCYFPLIPWLVVGMGVGILFSLLRLCSWEAQRWRECRAPRGISELERLGLASQRDPEASLARKASPPPKGLSLLLCSVLHLLILISPKHCTCQVPFAFRNLLHFPFVHRHVPDSLSWHSRLSAYLILTLPMPNLNPASPRSLPGLTELSFPELLWLLEQPEGSVLDPSPMTGGFSLHRMTLTPLHTTRMKAQDSWVCTPRAWYSRY